jgi:hypothetical protein
MVHYASIIIVPPDLRQLPCEFVVAEHGISRHRARAVKCGRLSRSVRRDLHLGQERVCVGVELFED